MPAICVYVCTCTCRCFCAGCQVPVDSKVGTWDGCLQFSITFTILATYVRTYVTLHTYVICTYMYVCTWHCCRLFPWHVCFVDSSLSSFSRMLCPETVVGLSSWIYKSPLCTVEHLCMSAWLPLWLYDMICTYLPCTEAEQVFFLNHIYIIIVLLVKTRHKLHVVCVYINARTCRL